MPQTVKLPDGTYINFPDSMSREDINAAMPKVWEQAQAKSAPKEEKPEPVMEHPRFGVPMTKGTQEASKNIGKDVASVPTAIKNAPELLQYGYGDIVKGPEQLYKEKTGKDTTELAERARKAAQLEQESGITGSAIRSIPSAMTGFGIGKLLAKAPLVGKLFQYNSNAPISNTAKATVTGATGAATQGYTAPVASNNPSTAEALRSDRAITSGIVTGAIPVTAGSAMAIKQYVPDWLKSLVGKTGPAENKVAEQLIEAESAAKGVPVSPKDLSTSIQKGIDYQQQFNAATGKNIKFTTPQAANSEALQGLADSQKSKIQLGLGKTNNIIPNMNVQTAENMKQLGDDFTKLTSVAEQSKLGDDTYKLIDDTKLAVDAEYAKIDPKGTIRTSEKLTKQAIKENLDTLKDYLGKKDKLILNDFLGKKAITARDLVELNANLAPLARSLATKPELKAAYEAVSDVRAATKADLANSPVEEIRKQAAAANDLFKTTEQEVYRRADSIAKKDIPTVFATTRDALEGSTQDALRVGKNVIGSPENIEDYLRAAKFTNTTNTAVNTVKSSLRADLEERLYSSPSLETYKSWIKDNQLKVDKVPGLAQDLKSVEEVASLFDRLQLSKLGIKSNQNVKGMIADELSTAIAAESLGGIRTISINSIGNLFSNLTQKEYNKVLAKAMVDPAYAKTILDAYKNPSEDTIYKAWEAINKGVTAAGISNTINSNTASERQKRKLNEPIKPLPKPQGQLTPVDATKSALQSSKKNNEGFSFSLSDLNPISSAEAAETKGKIVVPPNNSKLSQNVKQFKAEDKGALEQAVKKYSQNITDIMGLINAESSVSHKTGNGYAQMTPPAWKQAEKIVGRKLNRKSRQDYAEASVAYYKWTADQVAKITGKSDQATLEDVYPAYNAGISGFKALYTAPPNSLSKDVVPKEVSENNKYFYYNINTGKPLTTKQTLHAYKTFVKKKVAEYTGGKASEKFQLAAATGNFGANSPKGSEVNLIGATDEALKRAKKEPEKEYPKVWYRGKLVEKVF